ncbi:glycerophosphoryl diester phosphodiesterase [Leucobacter exalbidus]|uniref:glycerophosphodiester phosphodiesterase n=1 Tax=Leucobacter exalbidus TaxID=662960 RepID=A0A940PW60_9MICO|nr:glycerophosphodiester phosphodiesterase family protein [Leucobacter exalbidus]MBP1327350.1 glycerophosphoryl diester phosphodiesterase [Leucobacter exalbidus]
MHSQPHRTLVIGHRGAPGYRPEHSESSYRLAFELGADAVEPDIVVSKDGVLVVRHENEISGTTDIAQRAEFAHLRTTKTIDGQKLTGWFTEDLTWAELATLRCRERLPKVRPDNCRFDGDEPMLRLRDVLAIVDDEARTRGRTLQTVVEIKHAAFYAGLGVDIGALLLAELGETGWADTPERLVIEAFELGVLDRLREAGVAATLIYLTERAGTAADEPQPGAASRPYAWYRSDEGLDLLAGRVNGISVAKADLLRLSALGRAVGATDLVDRAHARGLSVFTWTLRPENRYLNLRFQSSLHGEEWGRWQREFAMILASGIDGIFVDHPDLGVATRDA